MVVKIWNTKFSEHKYSNIPKVY